METAVAAAITTGYALVVAFTTMPVLSGLGVLLGTRRASRGMWLAVGYAAGLAIVFALVTFGAAQFTPIRRFRPGGLFYVICGLMLIAIALVWWLWDRGRAARGRGSTSHSKFLDWVGTLGPLSCGMVGFQFAFHPENLVLTIAASRQVADLDPVQALVVLVWFCAVGVSTVAIPSLMYARSGERALARLESVRDWLATNGTMITVVLLLGVGVLMLGVGLWMEFT